MCIDFSKFDKNLIVARCGLRTNGDIHIGNMLPILTGFILGKKLLEVGKKLKLIIMLVDSELNGNEKPFIFQEDKRGCHNSVAEHSEEIIVSFVNDLKKIYPETEVLFCRVSEFLKLKEIKKTIKHLLSKGYANQIKVIERSSIPQFLLEHTFLGALENYYFKPDFHIIGGDHAIKNNGLSDLEKGDIYLRELKSPIPDRIVNPLILGENNKKMSKTERNGLFLDELKQKYSQNYLGKLTKIANELFGIQDKTIKFNEIKKLMEET